MFENYTVKVLKQHLRPIIIRGYSKMSKSQLVEEMHKYYIIRDGQIFPLPNVIPLPPGSLPIVEGGNAKAGYVKRMEAEKKIQFKRIKNPSKYMIDKYGNNEEPNLPLLEYEPDAPVFDANDVTDYNVGKAKKKKRTKRTPTEVEEERAAAKQQEELQRKKDLLENLESLKRQVVECNRKRQKEKNTYHQVVEEVQHNKERLRKPQKEEKLQQVIAKHRVNMQKIKDAYGELFQFIKDNGLNEDDLNEVHKYIRAHINKI
jgi:flagellar biosynthesis GTPase FlhF